MLASQLDCLHFRVKAQLCFVLHEWAPLLLALHLHRDNANLTNLPANDLSRPDHLRRCSRCNGSVAVIVDGVVIQR
jgi:hypothetical protein